jgi:hypothetical protein
VFQCSLETQLVLANKTQQLPRQSFTNRTNRPYYLPSVLLLIGYFTNRSP